MFLSKRFRKEYIEHYLKCPSSQHFLMEIIELTKREQPRQISSIVDRIQLNNIYKLATLSKLLNYKAPESSPHRFLDRMLECLGYTFEKEMKRDNFQETQRLMKYSFKNIEPNLVVRTFQTIGSHQSYKMASKINAFPYFQHMPVFIPPKDLVKIVMILHQQGDLAQLKAKICKSIASNKQFLSNNQFIGFERLMASSNK